MTAQDWTLVGWIWVAGLAVFGFGILFAPAINALDDKLVQPGQGTALLLIAASILFAAVFPTLTKGGNRLVPVAGVLTAVFGYAGTLVILAGENTLLLGIVIAFTIYLALTGFALVPVFRLIRYISTRLR